MVKIGIFSFCCNLSFPFHLQKKLFDRFVQDKEWEFVLLNDGITEEVMTKIDDVCIQEGIKTVKIPQSIHKSNDPSLSYADALNWFMRSDVIREFDVVVIVHTDVYPITSIKIVDILQDKYAAIIPESRPFNEGNLFYIYPALTFLDLSKAQEIEMIDFSCCSPLDDSGRGINLDTGGKTYLYLEKYKHGIRCIANEQLFATDRFAYGSLVAKYLELELKLCRKYRLRSGWICQGFYHYIAGSLWDLPRCEIAKLPTDISQEERELQAVNTIKAWFRYYKKKNYLKCHLRRMALLEALV